MFSEKSQINYFNKKAIVFRRNFTFQKIGLQKKTRTRIKTSTDDPPNKLVTKKPLLPA